MVPGQNGGEKAGLELTLRVREAAPHDAGRGLARLDPADMGCLGVETGDVLLLSGQRSTPVRAVPAHPDDRGQAVIRLDGITRWNARVNAGDVVRVRPVATEPARSVTLRPATRDPELGLDELRRRLTGVPLTAGDRLHLYLVGARRREFDVVRVEPGPVAVMGPASEIRWEVPVGRPEPSRLTYEDVGGLGQEVRRVRELVELPLRHPELFDRLGIDPPKGVLLHGPPGCGKTMIARAVAGETAARFFPVNGPEVMRKYYGESEAYLRSLFDQAHARAPSIIFLDELDAIAPRRSEARGDVERRVVAQLLTLMDGLAPRGQVVVIGATNMPDALDPALRRPGRFDREIAIGVPDASGRREILEIHSRGMPLEADVDLSALAARTHGYVGADLAALCREAAMHALHRLVPNASSLPEDAVSYDILDRLRVSAADFDAALREVEPSALREVRVEVPATRWEDVGGLEAVKQMLRETVEWPLKYGSLVAALAIRPARGILLQGPPGCGKTMLARALATESGLNFIAVKGPELLSKFVGESERAVREAFRKARQAAPCVLFFDEVDALLPRRGLALDSHVSDRVIGQFLTELDGIEELKGIVVLAATNRPDILDPAVMRPGRFDLVLQLPLPDLRSRAAIFGIHTRARPLSDDVDIEFLAAESEGLSGAEIAAACERAAMSALRRAVQVERTAETSFSGPLVTMSDLVSALAGIREESRG